jgi:phosphoglycolate phosphatase
LECLTKNEYRYAIKVLDRLGLSRYFAIVIGGDSLSFKKHDARVFQEVIANFEVSELQCLHVGDSAIDVQTPETLA